MSRCSPLALVLALVLATAPAAAQTAPEGAATFASPFVAPGHWSQRAARRLDALGLAPAGFDPADRSRTRRELARVFAYAVRRAEREAPDLAALARAYRARFAEEFAAAMRALTADSSPDGPRRTAARLGVGYRRATGRVLAGRGYMNGADWTGPIALDDVSSPRLAAMWSGALRPHLAVSISSAVGRRDGFALRRAQVTAVFDWLGLWAGRRLPGYGPGVGGGIVLNGSVAIDGGGLFLAEPLTLPWILGALGPVRFQAFLGRLERNGDVERPWFMGMRGSFAPHPRLHIGVSRAAIFGGEGNPVTLKKLAYLMIGKHAGRTSEFANQVVAVDLWYRPPLGPLPLALYAEWGIDDSAGAWTETPAILIGARLAAVPGLPRVAVGIERASFSRSCCGHTIWYRNLFFQGSRSDAGRPLGHPLGGHGTGWLGYARADLLDARLRVAARVFFRERGAENIFAPERAGSSRGGALEVAYRATPDLELTARGALEDGEGWRASWWTVGVRWLF